MKLASDVHRRRLWLGLAAVLVPLAVLLALQYRWLVKLDHTSAKADHAALKNYLEAVTGKVEWTYREDAERVLNLSPWIFTQDRLEKAAYHFKKKGVEGAQRLFVRSFSSHQKGTVLYFDPSCNSFVQASWSPEARAVYAATAPWSMLAQKQEPVERALLSVDERDPNYRVVLNPITDDSSRVVGVAGMVLDPDYFRGELLPEAIGKSLPKFFSEDSRQDPVVTVWDADGKVVFANGPTAERRKGSAMIHASLGGKPEKGTPEVERAFSFVFTDYHIGLTSRHATPAQVAKGNFILNFALSVALSTVILAGIVLALRTASREMKLSDMKNDFVSNVSHELRTPLASIRVFGEFLRLGRVENPDKVREYGEYIETESRRLTQLINNILDFASIESGRKSYRFERACVEEVVAETLKTFEIRLRQNGFRITYQGPEGSLPPVLLDPGAIAQSLSNLLDNAVKYSNGGREIQVAVRREGPWGIVAVRDQGIGIPKDEVDKIFDRFHRVSTGLVHDVKGSGLGLSIVRHIVEAHQGRVTVESRVGEGSTFSIWLPLEPPEPSPRAATPQPAEA
jgi:signal transduction histidine kinase